MDRWEHGPEQVSLDAKEDLDSSIFALTIPLRLESSILIRSAQSGKQEPDVIHLLSAGKPVLSGTSMAGALQARATKISARFQRSDLVKEMFGFSEGKVSQKSRLRVSEQTFSEGQDDLVQARVSIDRFTGGALETALFQEKPLLAKGDKTQTTLKLVLYQPTPEMIGLLLLLVKDLVTSDLAIGGESGVDRGRFTMAEDIHINYNNQKWIIPKIGSPDLATRETLQEFVNVFTGKDGNNAT